MENYIISLHPPPDFCFVDEIHVAELPFQVALFVRMTPKMHDGNDDEENNNHPRKIEDEPDGERKKNEREIQRIAGEAIRAIGDYGQSRLADVYIGLAAHDYGGGECQDAAYDGYNEANNLPGDSGEEIERHQPLQ